MPWGNSSSEQTLNLRTCFPASGCALSSSRKSVSSSSASGANHVPSSPISKLFGAEVSLQNSSQVSGPFFISVTRGMTSLFSAEEPPVTCCCFGKFCLLHHLRQKCPRVHITKLKAWRNRSRANWTLVFLTCPPFPSLSSLLKELSSKAMNRLSTWGRARGEWKI